MPANGVTGIGASGSSDKSVGNVLVGVGNAPSSTPLATTPLSRPRSLAPPSSPLLRVGALPHPPSIRAHGVPLAHLPCLDGDTREPVAATIKSRGRPVRYFSGPPPLPQATPVDWAAFRPIFDRVWDDMERWRPEMPRDEKATMLLTRSRNVFGTGTSSREWFWQSMPDRTPEGVIPLLLKSTPPSAHDLFLVGWTPGRQLAAYCKQSFSLVEGEEDVVSVGKSQRRRPLSYGVLPRFGEHMSQWDKDIGLDPDQVSGSFARAVAEARIRHGRVVHAPPTFSVLYRIPRQVGRQPSVAECVQEDAAVHLAETFYTRALGTLSDRGVKIVQNGLRGAVAPWDAAMLPYVAGNSRDQMSERWRPGRLPTPEVARLDKTDLVTIAQEDSLLSETLRSEREQWRLGDAERRKRAREDAEAKRNADTKRKAAADLRKIQAAERKAERKAKRKTEADERKAKRKSEADERKARRKAELKVDADAHEAARQAEAKDLTAIHKVAQELLAKLQAERDELLAKRQAEQDELLAKRQAEQDELLAKRQADQDELLAKRQAEQNEWLAKRQAEQNEWLAKRQAEQYEWLAKRQAEQDELLAKRQAEQDEWLARRKAEEGKWLARRKAEADTWWANLLSDSANEVKVEIAARKVQGNAKLKVEIAAHKNEGRAKLQADLAVLKMEAEERKAKHKVEAEERTAKRKVEAEERTAKRKVEAEESKAKRKVADDARKVKADAREVRREASLTADPNGQMAKLHIARKAKRDAAAKSVTDTQAELKAREARREADVKAQTDAIKAKRGALSRADMVRLLGLGQVDAVATSHVAAGPAPRPNAAGPSQPPVTAPLVAAPRSVAATPVAAGPRLAATSLVSAVIASRPAPNFVTTEPAQHALPTTKSNKFTPRPARDVTLGKASTSSAPESRVTQHSPTGSKRKRH